MLAGLLMVCAGLGWWKFHGLVSNGKLSSYQGGQISGAHTAFGWNLLRQLAGKEQGNIFISPASISLVMSMVYDGAEGETLQEMAKVLQFSGMTSEQVMNQSRQLITGLTNGEPDVTIKIANSVWADTRWPFQSQFMADMRTYFSAPARNADFTNPATADQINGWVGENTAGKISQIVNADAIRDIKMALINAVYFKGDWSHPFNASETEVRNFTDNLGKKKMIPMMRMERSDFIYGEDTLSQRISLPYGKTGEFRMVVVLPKLSADGLVGQLDSDSWSKWLTDMKREDGTLIMPKYKLEYEVSLADTLEKMGMPRAFSDLAEFNRMGRELKIGMVLHKTFIEVDEKGTEAAGITFVGMAPLAMGINQPPPKKFNMEVNKPFLIAIIDTKSGELLFTGLIRSI